MTITLTTLMAGSTSPGPTFAIANTYVVVGTGSNIAGSANLTWNGSSLYMAGGINVGGNGAAADPYGTIAMTQPANTINYSYYGLTRAGNIGAGFGLTGTTGALGVGTNAFWFGSATAGAAGAMSAAWVAFSSSAFSTVGEITAYASDKRLKTNIRPITNAIDKVVALNGVIYNWNDIASKHGFDQTVNVAGLFAQDVEAVLPEAVKRAPFDAGPNDTSISGEDYKTIQYEKLVPLLIEAIKEQQTMIIKQQQKIDQIQATLAELINK